MLDRASACCCKGNAVSISLLARFWPLRSLPAMRGHCVVCPRSRFLRWSVKPPILTKYEISISCSLSIFSFTCAFWSSGFLGYLRSVNASTDTGKGGLSDKEHYSAMSSGSSIVPYETVGRIAVARRLKIPCLFTHGERQGRDSDSRLIRVLDAPQFSDN